MMAPFKRVSYTGP